MNNKFYVSLEAAKKLKGLGYNEEYVVHYYNDNGEIILPWCSDEDYNEDKCYPRPSSLEAIDWLEDRDIHLEIRMQHCKVKGDPYKIADDDEYQWQYFYDICKGDDVENPIIACDESDCIIMYTDRNLCWQDAIAKGVSVL